MWARAFDVAAATALLEVDVRAGGQKGRRSAPVWSSRPLPPRWHAIAARLLRVSLLEGEGEGDVEGEREGEGEGVGGGGGGKGGGEGDKDRACLRRRLLAAWGADAGCACADYRRGALHDAARRKAEGSRRIRDAARRAQAARAVARAAAAHAAQRTAPRAVAAAMGWWAAVRCEAIKVEHRRQSAEARHLRAALCRWSRHCSKRRARRNWIKHVF